MFGRFEPARYVAIDISVQFLQGALECLQRQHPQLEMWGLGVDFSSGVQLPAPRSKRVAPVGRAWAMSCACALNRAASVRVG
ncbi:MAG: L-histidine N(alpha)-methyltransferase [Betaproteobacteria bacterium]